MRSITRARARRCEHSMCAHRSPGAQRASLRRSAVLHTIDLGADPDVLFRRFHRSQVRQNVRRGERDARVTVRRGESASDLPDVFYDLHVQTRRRHGMPVQPRRFFEALWAHVLAPGDGRRWCSPTSTAMPVAGAVFLDGNSTLTYKYSASDAAFWRFRPNHLLLWHALRSACEDGYVVVRLRPQRPARPGSA